MSYRIRTLMALAAACLAAGPLAAQQRSVTRPFAEPDAAGAGANAPSTAGETTASVPAAEGRRAKLARMYELQRGNRDIRHEISETAKVEHGLSLELEQLKVEAREGEREIVALDSAIVSTRAERTRLEARLRALEAIAIQKREPDSIAKEGQEEVEVMRAHDVRAADSAAAAASPTLVPFAAPVDSTPAAASDSAGPRPVAVSPRRRSHLRQWLYYGGVGAGVVAVSAFHLDSDPGGYRDGFETESTFPDKAVHLLAAWTITSLGADLKVGAWKSALAVCAGGVGFEFAQGYVSPYDIGANCLGAAGAAAWRSWMSR